MVVVVVVRMVGLGLVVDWSVTDESYVQFFCEMPMLEFFENDVKL